MSTIRRGRPRDLPDLLRLVAEYCDQDRHVFDGPSAEAALVPLLASDDHGVVWVAAGPDGRLEGYAVVTWGWSVESGGRDALLDEIYVRRRGEGLGTAFAEHVLADLGGRGIRRAFLETEAHNEDARRLYRRFGFQEEDSVWMSRVLDPPVP